MSLTLKQIRDRCQDDGDCWIWQQSLNGAGYPQAARGKLVRRMALAQSGKTPPSPRYVCMSTCHDKRCCNPDHLVWRQRKGMPNINKQRGVYEGYGFYLKMIANQKNIRLTWEKAMQIRQRLAHGEAQKELAKEFGVARSSISAIKMNKSWRLPDTHLMRDAA